MNTSDLISAIISADRLPQTQPFNSVDQSPQPLLNGNASQQTVTTPQTPQKSTVPFSWEDSDDEQKSDDDSERAGENSWFSCLYSCNRCHSLPQSFRQIINTFLVCLLVTLPGIVDLIVDLVQNGGLVDSFPINGLVLIGDIALINWCLLIAGGCVVYQLCRLAIFLLPSVIFQSYELLTGSLPRHYNIYFGYFRDLRFHLSNFLFISIVCIAWAGLFDPYGHLESNWRLLILQLFLVAFCASVFVLGEKLLVEVIAVRFHRIAFADRLKQVNYASDVISHLNIVSKRILKRKAQLQAFELKRQKMYQASEATGRQAWKKAFISGGPTKKHDKLTVAMDDMLLPSPNGKRELKQTLIAPALPLQRSRSIDGIMKTKELNSASELHISPSSQDHMVLSIGETIAVDSPISPSEKTYGSIFQIFKSDRKDNNEARRLQTIESHSLSSSSEAQASRLFTHIAKQISHVGAELSSQHAKRIAKRIFEALSPETAAYIKYVSGNGRSDLPNPILSRPTEFLTPSDFQPFFASKEEAHRAFEIFDGDGDDKISRQELKETCVHLQRDRKSLSASLRDIGSAIKKLDIVLSIGAAIVTLLTGLAIFGISLGSFLLTSVSLVLAVTFIFGNSAKNMFEGIVFLFIIHPYDVGDRVFVDGQNLIVKELGILVTVFTRWDGQLIYMPNSYLLNKDITNIRRSPNQIEVIEIQVALDTPQEKLFALKRKLNEYLHAESKDLVPKMELQPIEIQNLNKLRIQLFLEYKINWQDGDKRYSRRTNFIFFLKKTLEELDIGYRPVTQPVQFDVGKLAESFAAAMRTSTTLAQ